MKFPSSLLVGAIVVGAVLRGYQAGESLWLDELHTSWTVTGSIGEVAERAGSGNQSPLYFWLAWCFARLPIMPEVALRLPSLIAGCLLPLAMYGLTRKLLSSEKQIRDDTAPLLAAWLTALDPLAIFYAQEARPYALVQLLAVIHVGILWELHARESWKLRLAWIAGGALLVHLHYTAGLLLLAEGATVVVWMMMKRSESAGQLAKQPDSAGKTFLLNRALDALVVALLLLPALPGMLQVGERRQNWEAFVFRRAFFEIFTLYPWTPAVVALLVCHHWIPAISQRGLALLSCWLFVPLIATWLTTETGIAMLFFSRYLLAVWPASIIAAAACARLGVNAATQSILVGVILAIAVANGHLVRNWASDGRLLHDRNEDWRTALATLDPTVRSNHQVAPVLVRSSWIEADELPDRNDPLFREYCLAPVRGMYRIGPHHAEVFYPLTTTDTGRLQPDVREALLRAKEAMLLIRSSSIPEKRARFREQLLKDLQASLGSELIIRAEEPEEFGAVYLQRILIEPSQ